MRIEQILHGYADGHRLLAGSVDLPRQEKYLLLGLSDMSGRSMLPGFEEYLTGYPLPHAGFYAFARTWYAPEMERPGCVWTHTLLIREKDMSDITDLGTLRSLFRRPVREDRGDWNEYRFSLSPTERGQETTASPRMEQSLALALWGLYGTDLPLFQPAEDARHFEDMVLALWSQQWPGLRAAFRFCSGAIGVRVSGGTPFDYQVIPMSTIREARREVPASNVADSGGWTNPPESPDWLAIALNDLRMGGTSFRSFLREHACEGFGRQAFASLAELFGVWDDTSSRASLPQLLQLIGQRYPVTGDAARLKQAVVGPGFPLTKSLMPSTSECDVLKAIATTDGWAAFDQEKLGLDRRMPFLWESDRKSAEALIATLIGSDVNPIGEHVLLSLIQGMTIEDAIRYSDAIPGLVATVVRMNPDLAMSPSLWKGSVDYQRGLFDAATSAGIPVDTQSSIIQAMLQAGSDAAAERATKKFGTVAVNAVMNWFDGSGLQSHSDLREGWRRALAPHTTTLLDWLAYRDKVREASGALIADLSNPHSMEVRQRGADLWLKVLSDDKAVPANTRTRLYAFCLALGFDSPAGNPDELVAHTFDTVNSAVAGSRLGEDSWAWLDDHLPALAIWRYWDRCERLRRGLAQRFVNHNWPAAKIFRCAPNRDDLRDLLKSCDKVDGGRKLLKRIRRALSEDDVDLDRQRREVVEWYA
jgi:hypothetical protein